jgi:hypothetical protein
MTNKHLQVLNIVGFLGVLTMNFLAVSLPLMGRTPGEISDLFPSLFTPAGFTFSIWSVIYILLAIFVFRQANGLFKKGKPAPESVSVIGWLFFINCLCNIAWLFAWHSLSFSLSFLLMLGILATLIIIYLKLRNFGGAHWLTTLPFSIYLGWITVATIANASVLLIDLEWDGFGIAGATWAAIMIGAGTLIGLGVLFRERDTWYVLVLIWAFFGIYSKRAGETPVVETVTTAAMVAAIVLLISSVSVGLLKFRRR